MKAVGLDVKKKRERERDGESHHSSLLVCVSFCRDNCCNLSLCGLHLCKLVYIQFAGGGEKKKVRFKINR